MLFSAIEIKHLLEKVHRFSHKAMATEFEIFICYEDYNYSSQAAQAAFSELDRLELELSRFIENSDISRINNLNSTQIALVGMDTFECLRQCKKLFYATNGAFDVSIGNLWKTWMNKNKSLRNPTRDEINFAKDHTGMNHIELNETNYTVKLLCSPLLIDLGGFGKGYALDKMAEILNEWEIDHVLFQGGKSSVLALEAPPDLSGWPVSLSNPFSTHIIKELYLKNRAVSGSGLHKGQHIIDSRIGKPVEQGKVTWASATTAAISDALSTAFMLMSEEEIKNYCKNNDDVGGIIIEAGHRSELAQFGFF